MRGPPKVPREERLDTSLKRTAWEYRQDSELRQELDMAKRASLNALLLAVFLVATQNETMFSCRPADKQTTEELVNKEHAIDSGQTKEFSNESP